MLAVSFEDSVFKATWALAFLNALVGVISRWVPITPRVRKTAVSIWAVVILIVCFVALRKPDAPKGQLYLALAVAFFFLGCDLLGGTILSLYLNVYWSVRLHLKLADAIRTLAKTPKQKNDLLEHLQRLLSVCRNVNDVEWLSNNVSWPSEAGPAQVSAALKSENLYHQLPEEKRRSRRAQITQAFHDTKLFRHNPHGFSAGANRQLFALEFDLFRFLTAEMPDELIALRYEIRSDIEQRFGANDIHALVYIAREREAEAVTKFFEGLKFGNRTVPVVRYPSAGPDSSINDPTTVASLTSMCQGKNVLLLDPMMVDEKLDEAYQTITHVCSGTVAGTAIIFEVHGVDPGRLRRQPELSQCAGALRLCGQVVLDLVPLRGHDYPIPVEPGSDRAASSAPGVVRPHQPKVHEL